ncbi:MAG: lipase family protein [Mycolicibacterium insubricum]|nr:lipase [Mycobacterium sp.]
MTVAEAIACPKWIDVPEQWDRATGVPLLPSEDPFFTAPEGFEHAEPGTVLRTRDVQLGLFGIIPQRITAVQLLFRTQDCTGAPEAAVTTVLIPAQRSSRYPTPVLSYQCAIDAVADRCFPSYALRQGSGLRRDATSLGSVVHIDFLMIAAALAEGWIISVPDHEGLNGRWGAPAEPGYRSLDALRATLSFDRSAVPPDAPIGLWGYSGGGLATGWTAELAGYYAPELNIVGAALGSPVGDLGKTFHRLNGSTFSGLPATVVAALTHVYPELHKLIDTHANATGKAMLARIETLSTVQAVLSMFRKDMDDLVDCPLEELTESPELVRIFDEIRLGHNVPEMPLLVVQAVHDQIIAVEAIDELTARYTAGGAQVAYHRDLFSEHLSLHPLAAPMALRWLTDRFDNRPVTDNMVRTVWPTLLNPITYAGMARLGAVLARLVGGQMIRRNPL